MTALLQTSGWIHFWFDPEMLGLESFLHLNWMTFCPPFSQMLVVSWGTNAPLCSACSASLAPAACGLCWAVISDLCRQNLLWIHVPSVRKETVELFNLHIHIVVAGFCQVLITCATEPIKSDERLIPKIKEPNYSFFSLQSLEVLGLLS